MLYNKLVKIFIISLLCNIGLCCVWENGRPSHHQSDEVSFFDSVDDDGDGRITQNEIRNYVEEIGGQAFNDAREIENGVQSILANIDRNEDQILTTKDFGVHWSKLHKILTVEESARWAEHAVQNPTLGHIFRENSVTGYDIPSMLMDPAEMEELGIAKRHQRALKRAISIKLIGLGREPSPPMNFDAVSITCTSMVLRWSPPQEDSGVPVHKYVLERHDTSSKGSKWAMIYNGLESTYVEEPLDFSKEYRYRLQAWNLVGHSEYTTLEGIDTTNLLFCPKQNVLPSSDIYGFAFEKLILFIYYAFQAFAGILSVIFFYLRFRSLISLLRVDGCTNWPDFHGESSVACVHKLINSITIRLTWALRILECHLPHQITKFIQSFYPINKGEISTLQNQEDTCTTMLHAGLDAKASTNDCNKDADIIEPARTLDGSRFINTHMTTSEKIFDNLTDRAKLLHEKNVTMRRCEFCNRKFSWKRVKHHCSVCTSVFCHRDGFTAHAGISDCGIPGECVCRRCSNITNGNQISTVKDNGRSISEKNKFTPAQKRWKRAEMIVHTVNGFRRPLQQRSKTKEKTSASSSHNKLLDVTKIAYPQAVGNDVSRKLINNSDMTPCPSTITELDVGDPVCESQYPSLNFNAVRASANIRKRENGRNFFTRILKSK